MADVGSLVTKFEADNSSLLKGVDQANKALTGFASKGASSINSFSQASTSGIEKVGRSIERLIKGFLAFEGLKLFKEFISQIGDLYDNTQKIGIAVDKYQALASVSRAAGLSSEGLNTALAKLKISIGQASLGNDKLNGDFTKLGLNIANLSKLTPDQQFLQIAEALGKVTDKTQQAALAQEIFGRGGKEALGLINSNIPKAIKNYEDLGISITTAQAAAVDQFDDSRKLLGEAITGFGQQLIVELAPVLKDVTEYILNFIKQMGGIKGIAQDFKDILVGAFELAEKIAENISINLQKKHIDTLKDQLFNSQYDKSNVDPNNIYSSQDIASAPAFSQDNASFGSGLDLSFGNTAYNKAAIGGFISSPSATSRLNPELKELQQQIKEAQMTLSATETPLASQPILSSVKGGLPLPEQALSSLAAAAKQASESVQKLGDASKDAFTSAFASNSGLSDQINRIVKGTDQKPIAKDEDFDRIAADILDNVQKYGVLSSGDQTQLNVLQGIATNSGYAGENNSAQLSAVTELKKYIAANAPTAPEVKVSITVDKDGIIKAVVDSDASKFATIQYAKDMINKEAIGVNR